MASNEEYLKKNKVTIVDEDKNTRLHYAAVLGSIDEIKKTVKNRQKLDPVNYLGWTPLMMAVRTGNAETVELLLENGADATKKNKFGVNVFLISVTCGDLKIVERILNHLLCGGVSRQSMQKVMSPLSVAILFQHDQIIRYLLLRRFDPNVAMPFTGLTPLMFAAAVGNNKAFHQLLEFNADINAKNHLGKGALDIRETRTKNIDIVSTKRQKPQVPMIIISPQNSASPHFQLTGHMDSVNLSTSSNITTPLMLTPGVSPVTPQISPYFFFSPDFTPTEPHFINYAVSPLMYSSFLNHAISPSSALISPQ